MLATAATDGQSCAAASTADPPKECPTSRCASRPESVMNSTARTVSATLCENDPSPQSPSESPSPRLSKRSMPMPSLASCLQMRVAAGLSLPSVKPCANTPHPRTSPSGRSMRPARTGPVVLGNSTRSATVSADQLRVELRHHPGNPVAPVDRCAADQLAHQGGVGRVSAQRSHALLENRFPADQRADVGAPVLQADGLLTTPIDGRRGHRRLLEQLGDHRDDVVLVNWVVHGGAALGNLNRDVPQHHLHMEERPSA